MMMVAYDSRFGGHGRETRVALMNVPAKMTIRLAMFVVLMKPAVYTHLSVGPPVSTVWEDQSWDVHRGLRLLHVVFLFPK